MPHLGLAGGIRRVASVIAALSMAIGAPAPAEGATRHVFTTFTGDAGQRLSVYTSSDGLNFTLLSNTGYTGPTGVLRDPAITKHRDGTYFIAYTLQSWTTQSASFAIASSSDLLNWTFVTEVPAQVAGASYTWAPDWFLDTDGSINLIVSIDNLGAASSFSAYKFTATNDTLSAWSAPTPIGIGPNYIDTFIVERGGTYHAFSKNETTKYIEHATASSVTGPWTWVGTGDWAGFGAGKEGPALFQLDDGQWRMFMDCYTGCGYLYTTSSDLDGWSTTATVPGGLSGVVRHGAVLKEEIAGSGDAGAGSRLADGAAPAVDGMAGTTGEWSGVGANASPSVDTASRGNGGCSMSRPATPALWVALYALGALIRRGRRAGTA